MAGVCKEIDEAENLGVRPSFLGFLRYTRSSKQVRSETKVWQEGKGR
jgi:hypothetical protein